MIATLMGHHEALGALLEGKADGNALCDGGWTPLGWAAGENDLEAVRLLLAAKALPDKAASGGHTALFKAASGGHDGAVQDLLLAKANPDAATALTGDTPLMLAAQKNHPRVIALLAQRAECDLKARTITCTTRGSTWLKAAGM